MKIGILYNYVETLSRGFEQDKIADNEIVEIVQYVEKALSSDHDVTQLKISPALISQLKEGHFDFIFNLCEGFEGNVEAEALIPALLELLRIPFTGSNHFTLALCLDKVKTKQFLIANDIPTPKFQVFSSSDATLSKSLLFPLIVKPVHEDASIGITLKSVVQTEVELRLQIQHVIDNYHQPALVEEFIDGREINVALMGNGNQIEILPISEIIFDLDPSIPRIIDYESKWVEDSYMFKHTKGVCPAQLDPEIQTKAEDIARKAYQITGCRDYARVDFRIRGSEIFVLEVNPNPGINADSGFFRCAQTSGLTYAQMIQKIIEISLIRYQIENHPVKISLPFPPTKPYFTSDRLNYYLINRAHLEILQQWFNNPDISKYLADPKAIYDTNQLILDYLLPESTKLELEGVYLIAEDKDSKRKIGYCAIYDIQEWNLSAEISYLLGDPTFQGKGYAREMIQSLISISRDNLFFNRLEASVTIANIASWKALEHAGFRRIGYRTGSHVLKGEKFDEYIYEFVL